jgi:hypothetical protein
MLPTRRTHKWKQTEKIPLSPSTAATTGRPGSSPEAAMEEEDERPHPGEGVRELQLKSPLPTGSAPTTTIPPMPSPPRATTAKTGRWERERVPWVPDLGVERREGRVPDIGVERRKGRPLEKSEATATGSRGAARHRLPYLHAQARVHALSSDLARAERMKKSRTPRPRKSLHRPAARDGVEGHTTSRRASVALPPGMEWRGMRLQRRGRPPSPPHHHCSTVHLPPSRCGERRVGEKIREREGECGWGLGIRMTGVGPSSLICCALPYDALQSCLVSCVF